MEIKVGICIAYDWSYLKTSLPIIYPHVDKICLSIDRDRISWSGNPFEFNVRDFEKLIKEIDEDQKILFYEDEFHAHEDPMVNEILQRNKMADQLGRDSGWHIQLDVDEYPVDMKGLVGFLKKNQKRFTGPVNICLPWITLFKKVNNGFLIIYPSREWMQIACNFPKYEYGRRNGFFNYKLNSPVLHQSWARSDAEIQNKVKNWGHSKHFNGMDFYEFWKGIDDNNYVKVKDFHPEEPHMWQSLVYLEASSINQILKNPRQSYKIVNKSNLRLLLENNRFIKKLSSLRI